MTSLNTFFGAVLALFLLAMSPGKLFAHGYVKSPAARGYQGSLDKNTLGYSIAFATYGTVINEPQSLETLKGFPAQGPPDGRIASANGAIGGDTTLDIQTATRWTKTNINTGVNSFTWEYTAYHATTKWHYYMTKQGWNPNQPLSRQSLELIGTVMGNGALPQNNVPHQINIPGDRSGYHVILAIWDVANTVNGFYNVIDVNVLPSNSSTAPATPSGLGTVNVTSTTAKISWTPQADAVSYTVYRNGTSVQTVSIAEFEDTGLSPATSYAYTVKATNAAGLSSAMSATHTVTTQSQNTIELPTTPSGLHSMGVTANSVSLMWMASTHTQGIDKYEIYENGTKVAESTTTSYMRTGLAAATQYSYRVKAVAHNGATSAASNELTITTSAPLATPGGFATVNLTSTTAKISWTPQADAVSYTVYRDGTSVQTVSIAEFEDTGLSPATSYAYTVKATNAAGLSSAISAPYTVTTQSQNTIELPTTPSGLHAMAVTANSVSLMWMASTHTQGIDKYEIYENGAKVAESTTTSYMRTGLAAATQYSYTVKAVAHNGATSAAGNELTITTTGNNSSQLYCGQQPYNTANAYPTAHTKVFYNCKIWENKWYANPNEIPGVDMVWQQLSICTESPGCQDNGPVLHCGFEQYSNTMVYASSNTNVFYNCKIWRNKWYANAGEAPGDNMVWEVVSDCNEGAGCSGMMRPAAPKEPLPLIISDEMIRFASESSYEKVSEVYVFNSFGTRMLHFRNNGKNLMPISSLAPGVYIVKVIYKDGRIATQKVGKPQ